MTARRPECKRAAEPGVSRRQLALVAAATLACLLPFAGKAFHIDDHRYVQMARQIRHDPLDFFGFSVNLAGSEQPFAAMGNNPPLASFYAAAASFATGWSELGLHLAFLLPALGVTLATWALGRRLGADALLAALFCLASPLFLVSATTLMADVLMLALFCGSIACWRWGLEARRPAALLAGGALAALCALTKYFGVALVPLLLAWSWYRERRLGRWAAYLILPVAVLVAFELYTLHRYGAAPLLRASGFAVTSQPGEFGGFERLLVTVVFAGGLLAPILFFAPVVFSRRMLLASAGLGAALLATCLAWGRLAGHPLAGAAAPDANFVAHLAVFSLAGAALFVLLGADLSRRLDADSLLLALWVFGTFVFAGFVNYTTNARTLLPLAPAVAILLGRRVRVRRAVRPLRSAWIYAPLLPAFALALATAWGDASLADASRLAARQVAARYAGHAGTLWCEGYWGFQHYAQLAGARPVDVRRSVLRPGDLLVSYANAMPRLRVSPRAATLVETLEFPVAPITTMAAGTATGFYAVQWGPLPYRYLPGYVERFEVRRIDQPLLFASDPSEIQRRGAELERSDAWLASLRSDPEACPSLGDAIAACRWCATREECADCLGAELERRAAPPACVARLERSRPGR